MPGSQARECDCAGRVIRKGISEAVRFFEDEPKPPPLPGPSTERRTVGSAAATTAAPTASDVDGSHDGSCGGSSGPRFMRPLLRSPTYTTRMLQAQGPLIDSSRVERIVEPPVPLRVRKVTASACPSLRAGHGSLIRAVPVQPWQVRSDSSVPSQLRQDRIQSARTGPLCIHACLAGPEHPMQYVIVLLCQGDC